MASQSLERRQEAIIIPISSSTSGPWVVDDMKSGSIKIPAAMTGTTLTIEGIVKAGDSFLPLNDAAEVALVMTFTVAEVFEIPSAAFSCWAIRFISNGTEAAARTLEGLAKGG